MTCIGGDASVDLEGVRRRWRRRETIWTWEKKRERAVPLLLAWVRGTHEASSCYYCFAELVRDEREWHKDGRGAGYVHGIMNERWRDLGVISEYGRRGARRCTNVAGGDRRLFAPPGSGDQQASPSSSVGSAHPSQRRGKTGHCGGPEQGAPGVSYCIFAEWNCFHRQRNGQSSMGGQHINASRLGMPQGRQLRRWQEVGGGRPWRLVGVEGKKQKFGIRSVFGDPLPTATEYLMCKRDWCFLFNLRHTHTILTPHWRNSSTIADESECGCGVANEFGVKRARRLQRIDQYRGAERNWRGIGIQLTQYTADMKEYRQRQRIWRSERQPTAAIGGPMQIPGMAIPARAPAYGKNGRRDRHARERIRRRKQEEGQNGESGFDRQEWCKACMSRRPNGLWYPLIGMEAAGNSKISEFSAPTLIATSTKVAPTKGETPPKRNAAARQRQAAVTADRVRRFWLMQERQGLTTTVEKIHAVNISDGGKEHAGPAQTTAS
ncbi:hypothetical protein B0H14DRAFT_3170146 [Mycena olivaceomarginata]|nr:hypothetical protein B0H14DRAFT_3170146 [Mycena olivaceomarginata]